MIPWIKTIGKGNQGSRHLTYEEAADAAQAIASGASTEAQNAAFFIALRMKGETEDELKAFADVFRSCSLPLQAVKESLSCAGNDAGRRRFAVTLPVSLLLAAVGFPQVLHGGQPFRQTQGVALKDIVEELGVSADLPASAWEKLFFREHIGFLWTDRLCPPIGRLRQVREQLGLPTVMNMVERMINPVRSSYALIGVHHQSAMEKLTPLARQSDFQTVYMVQGIDGSEDLPIWQKSLIRIVTPRGDESRWVEPEKFGFGGEPLAPIDRKEQLAVLRRVIAGDDAPELRTERDHVVFNAGLRLMWFDKVGSYEQGFQLAADMLQQGEADKMLRRWIEESARFAGRGKDA